MDLEDEKQTPPPQRESLRGKRRKEQNATGAIRTAKMDAAWEGSREDDSSFAAEAPDHLLRYFANQAWLQEQELLNRQITPHTELPPPSEGEMERVLTALMGTALRPQSAATPSHSETKLDESRMQDQMLAMFQSHARPHPLWFGHAPRDPSPPPQASESPNTLETEAASSSASTTHDSARAMQGEQPA